MLNCNSKVRNYSGKLTKPDNVNFFVADFDRGLDWYEKTYFSHRIFADQISLLEELLERYLSIWR